jgi:hypothetical protein
MAPPLKQILDYDDYAAIPPDGKRWELPEGDVHETPSQSPTQRPDRRDLHAARRHPARPGRRH